MAFNGAGGFGGDLSIRSRTSSSRLVFFTANPLQSSAVTKAEARFRKAETALEAIRNTDTIGELESAWTDYLVSHNSIFTILEQGAKVSPRSRQWFGGKKEIRRKDPLLNYLHQARNADEHDIPSVVESKLAGGITLGDSPAGPDRVISKVTFKPIGGRQVVIGENAAGLSNVTLLRPVFLLCRVYDDRYKTYFDPPTEHLGKSLDNPRPIGVAEAGVAYTSQLIAEAWKQVTP